MSHAVELLSSKGLQLALQQQQSAPSAGDLPDYVTSRHDAPNSFIHSQIVTPCSCFGDISAPAAACLQQLHAFIETHARAAEREWLSHVVPTSPSRWQPVPVIERLKQKAKVLVAIACMLCSQ